MWNCLPCSLPAARERNSADHTLMPNALASSSRSSTLTKRGTSRRSYQRCTARTGARNSSVKSLAAASGGTLRLHSIVWSTTSPWPSTWCANACASAKRCSTTGRAALTKMNGTPPALNAAATGRSAEAASRRTAASLPGAAR